MRSRRRAHLGGRSLDGNVQAILARRQFEHGEFLSHFTLRRRHITQLRSFGMEAETDAVAGAARLVGGDPVDVAFFSESKAEAFAVSSRLPFVAMGSA